MSWWNWQDEEPNEFACGHLSLDGWAENDCAEELRYICERGMDIELCACLSFDENVFFNSQTRTI